MAHGIVEIATLHLTELESGFGTVSTSSSPSSPLYPSVSKILLTAWCRPQHMIEVKVAKWKADETELHVGKQSRDFF